MVNTFTNINNTNNDLNSLITKKTRTYANENPGSVLGTAHKCDRSLGSKHLLIGSRITNIKNKYKKKRTNWLPLKNTTVTKMKENTENAKVISKSMK